MHAFAFITLCFFTLMACAPVLVAAEACASICSTPDIYGYDSNVQVCQCDPGVGPNRSGPNNCNCDACYKLQDGKVVAYSYVGGVCTLGEDCGHCDLQPAPGSDGGSAANATPKPTPTPPTSTTPPPSPKSDSSSTGSQSLTPSPPDSAPTPSPAPTPTPPPPSTPSTTSSSSSSSTTTNDGNNNADGTKNDNASGSADTSNGTSGSSGLKTWQIALIICSSVLVFAVVMMAIMSCYCKTRNAMMEHQAAEEDTQEYQGYWNPDGNAPELLSAQGKLNNSTVFSGTGVATAYSPAASHSRPGSAKNAGPLSESLFAVGAEDRIGAYPPQSMGPPPSSGGRGSLGASAASVHMYDRRPSHDAGSRSHIAIEL